MSKAEQIRQYVLTHIIEPARNRGERIVTVTAGEIADAMGLRSPEGYKEPRNVCQALTGRLFAEMANVRATWDGAKDSTATRIIIELL